ncbi:MAG: polysaccharide biosynthesis protein [Lachnospiraceae bacterium]|nr:polysaccharide biosynthesis protein [Lachnospiraceae bacterium]
MAKKVKATTFLAHGGILAVASILVRFIGMIYRIPMVNIIGSEGNGYYSTAYSVYNILLLLSSYSLPLAVSKLVSARTAVGKWKETKRILVVAFAFAGVVGLTFSLLTFFLADFFCTKVMGSPMAAVALKWLAPTIFIMAVLGVLRGFFQGLQTMIPTAISQILEQIVNAFVSVGMAAALFQYGKEISLATGDGAYAPAWGAAGGTIGTGAGAFMALAFCICLFYLYRGNFNSNLSRDRNSKVRPYGRIMKKLALTAVPIIISTAAYNCIDIIDVVIFNHSMKHIGYTVNEYSSVWGDYNSAFMILIHLPVAFASAIASALVPSLSAAYAEEDRDLVIQKISITIRTVLLIALPFSLGMMAIGGNLAKLLFPSIGAEAQKYLVVGGFAVLFYSLATVTNAILQGMNRLEKPVIHNAVSLLVHIALMFFFLYVLKLEIIGVIIAYMIFGLVTSALNLLAIYKLTGYLPEPIREVALPFAASFGIVLICLLVSFIISRFAGGKAGNLLIVLISFIIGFVAYFILIFKLGCVSRTDVIELPGGKKLAGILRKVGLV